MSSAHATSLHPTDMASAGDEGACPEDDACTVKDALTETGRQKARAMKAREQPFSVEVLRGRNGWW